MFASVLPAAQSSAAPAASASDKKDWTVDDILLAERADSLRISPDGQWAVWVKRSADTDKDGTVSNLYLSSLTEKREVQLTRGSENNSSPKWSPDGRLIAFVSSRPLPKPPKDGPGKPAPTQLWLINPFGGEPWPLTQSERGVRDFDWIDSATLLAAIEEDPTLYERKLEEGKDNSRMTPRTRLQSACSKLTLRAQRQRASRPTPIGSTT